MFPRLVRKELLHYLLDYRFVSATALCVVLTLLGTHVGVRNYEYQLREYNAISEANRHALQEWLDKNIFLEFMWVGYRWNRPPEVLSPVVYGLSGKLGQEVNVNYRFLPEFEGSLFETDPIHALFGVLDLSFIVRIVLSLCVLLFTYDAICGEKEAGTLRLCASFPVSRSAMALAKLAGAWIAIFALFALAYLLSSVVLALSPSVKMGAGEWGRMAVLMGVFGLYLTVFTAFGLCVSALTDRRMTAFLILLGLWVIWTFVVPNLGVRIARSAIPVPSLDEIDGKRQVLRQETRDAAEDESVRQWGVQNWVTAPEKSEVREALRKIESKWDAVYSSRLTDLLTERRNLMRRQWRLAMALSAVSPFSMVSFASMDLARTGAIQQERMEDALKTHQIYLAQFIREKQFQLQNRGMTDFVPFTYQDREGMQACLSRNAAPILIMALLAVLGFAGAYVAVLRYDVR